MQARMPFTILLTGFGPFPGAPFNPTGALVHRLARRRDPAFAGTRRIAHVFRTSYSAVDRDLCPLIAHVRPDVIIMFGLAARTQTLRIEMRARNALTRKLRDAGGVLPETGTIRPGGPAQLVLNAPAQRLAMAARTAGLPARLSRDAGDYLCNYLCWRASEAAAAADRRPRVVTFVHVPLVRRSGRRRVRSHRPPFALDDLARAAEAILRAAAAAARLRR
jgi:pyroglutamyl-peptidase